MHKKFRNFFPAIKQTGGALLLLAVSVCPAHADDGHIERLQKAASIAYDRMMQAKQSAEDTAKDAAFTARKRESLKQKLTAAEQEYDALKKKSEQAKSAFEQAEQHWKQASDALALEWKRNEESR